MKISQWYAFRDKYLAIDEQLTKALEPLGLQCNDFHVLYHLYYSDNHMANLTELTRAVNLSQSAMSRLIQRLENRPCGVVTRIQDPKDKRSTYIKITKNGEKLYQEAEAKAKQILEGQQL